MQKTTFFTFMDGIILNEITFIIVLFVASIVSTYYARKYALKKSILDIPNKRSSHSTPTPRVGGLAIAILWYTLLIVLFFNGKIDTKLFAALISGILLTIVSFVDDILSINPKFRLLAQISSSIIGLYFIGGLQLIDFGFASLNMPLIVNLLVVFGVVWFINLFNFLDGTDGYLGSEGVFIFLSLFIFIGDLNALYFVAIIAGFLIWNWPKAKIFCGDVGSTLIGYNLAIFSIYYQNAGKLSIIIPLILSGLFWVDATITLYRRWRNNEELSQAHKKHAYQRLNQFGYSHLTVLLIGWSINIILFLISFLAVNFSRYLLIFMLIQISVVFTYIRLVDKKIKFE